jgi:hypothetical protein
MENEVRIKDPVNKEETEDQVNKEEKDDIKDAQVSMSAEALAQIHSYLMDKPYKEVAGFCINIEAAFINAGL